MRGNRSDTFAGPDAPPYTDHEESEEAVVEGRCSFRIGSARTRPRSTRAFVWRARRLPKSRRTSRSLEDGLKEPVDAVKEACVAAEAQDEGRERAAARR